MFTIAAAAMIGDKAAPHNLLRLNTGAHMPALGFGTWQLNGEELRQALQIAIANGYRRIDTAAGYGNEGVVADVLMRSGIPRTDFFVTSKLWCTDHGSEDTYNAILSSLAELQTEYIDLFLMHAPNNLGETAEEIVELRRQSWVIMQEFHRAGALRAIGVSNFEPRHIEQLLEWGATTPAVNQVELHAYLAQHELRKYCAKNDIVVESFGSIGANGLLDDPVMQRIALAHGRSSAQVSLRYSLQRGYAVLARSVTPSHIAANANVFDFQLLQDEMRKLDGLDCGERSYWDNSDVP
mmetsp:Transcript_73253/g.122302  ORF Transcript_73253/g.122302 Transcript_73253/m.122302 type:complete len:295 (-) Transcript_73253:177-1061(-)|eukprot:CAMPEP_0119327212 /NCGR_PEP_ID=MMETSP1333-20130426/70156_1 /TAXON_ID=418940 /ORGANISM="Scyphosphaera apsteinii, Strain RCC1455" /LENGTH=294 /DNA_ID=CAMNT_0007335725 /DNA_START=21 /DNA_END=905 /DNA_ORIENTATION=-